MTLSSLRLAVRFALAPAPARGNARVLLDAHADLGSATETARRCLAKWRRNTIATVTIARVPIVWVLIATASIATVSIATVSIATVSKELQDA